jgi:hypothetical protein
MMIEQFPNLKRKASRWQQLPAQGEEDAGGFDFDITRISVLLSLRDLSADPVQWEAVKRYISNAPNAGDRQTIAGAFSTAMEAVKEFPTARDYIVTNKGKRRRRVNLAGNPGAQARQDEHDELIRLARTVWSEPDNLGDVLGDLEKATIRAAVPADQKPVLAEVYEWARSWADVRYRFLNHALRDDPVEFVHFKGGDHNPLMAKGIAANSLVHSSDVRNDYKIINVLRAGGFGKVNTRGFDATDREFFQTLYGITPTEASQVDKYSGVVTGLRMGLPPVFKYCADFIDAYINWRIKVLEAARRMLLVQDSVKYPKNPPDKRFPTKDQAIADLHKAYQELMGPADDSYKSHFLPALRKLLREASKYNAFNRESYNALETASRRTITSVTSCTLPNEIPELRNSNQFRMMRTQFPGQNVRLIMPTGTSLLVAPRTPRMGSRA